MAAERLDGAAELGAWYAGLRADGDPAHRMGWTDRRQQFTGFEILSGIADLRAHTVLDAGCGAGDLYAFLSARGYHGAYTGVDLVAASIAEAATRFPAARWLAGDALSLPLAPHDYVLASGLFDVRTPDSPARLRATLTRLFGLARRGLAWNMFTPVPGGRAPRQYVEPLADILAFCETLSPWLVLRQDYAPGQFTLYLYQPAHFVTPALEAVIGRLFVDKAFRARLAGDPESVVREYGLTWQQLGLVEGVIGGP